MTAAALGENGRRVRCSICAHEWFQNAERLQELWEGFIYEDFPDSEIKEIQSKIASGEMDMKQKKAPRGAFTLFLGNLPFSFLETEIKEMLEGESIDGVVAISVAKDAVGRSRGFAFVQLETVESGQKALTTLSDLTIEGRPLSVKEGDNNQSGGGAGRGGRGGGGGGRGRGGGRR